MDHRRHSAGHDASRGHEMRLGLQPHRITPLKRGTSFLAGKGNNWDSLAQYTMQSSLYTGIEAGAFSALPNVNAPVGIPDCNVVSIGCLDAAKEVCFHSHSTREEEEKRMFWGDRYRDAGSAAVTSINTAAKCNKMTRAGTPLLVDICTYWTCFTSGTAEARCTV